MHSFPKLRLLRPKSRVLRPKSLFWRKKKESNKTKLNGKSWEKTNTKQISILFNDLNCNNETSPCVNELCYTSDDSATTNSSRNGDDNDGNNERLDQENKILASKSQDETDPNQKGEFDAGTYLNKREMTPLQERFNAITVTPGAFFCIYFVLTGQWMHPNYFTTIINQTMRDFDQHEFNAETQCIRSDMFPQLHAMPPLPVLVAAAAIIIHAPFSFLYHWRYASNLPPGMTRVGHWSRRLDHSFIHIGCALTSYGTSGSLFYFLLNIIYSIDCVHRQFQKEIRPRQNQIRIALSTLAYILPILWKGNLFAFGLLMALLVICLWLFVTYPIGGWSHGLFHIVVSFATPIQLASACVHAVSQDQIQIALLCES